MYKKSKYILIIGTILQSFCSLSSNNSNENMFTTIKAEDIIEQNQEKLDSIHQFIKKHGDTTTVLINFDDQAIKIPDDFTIPNFIKHVIIIGKNLAHIGNDFLSNSLTLTTIALPDSIIFIEDSFLTGCTGLRNLKLPEKLISAGNYFLANCSGLTDITLPNSLTSFGSGFLWETRGLKTLSISQKTLEALKSLKSPPEILNSTTLKIIITKENEKQNKKTGPSSIVHKSLQYIDQKNIPVHLHATLGNLKDELIAIAKDYWNGLKDGDSNLFNLITPEPESEKPEPESEKPEPESEKNDYNPLGLLPRDIQNIKKHLLDYYIDTKLSPNIEYFGFSKLPTWLDIYYESKQDDLLNIALGIIPTEDQNKQEANSSATAAAGGNPKDPFPLLGPKNIRKSVANYIIQRYYKARNQPEKYLFVKKGIKLSSEFWKKEKEKIDSILSDASTAFAYIEDEDLIKCQFLVVKAQNILDDNMPILAKLTTFLDPQSGDPDLHVIIAFDDQDTKIPNNFFKIPNLIQNLIIVGRNLTSVGHSFLAKCTKLKSLELPNSLTTVGNAFLAGCTKLKSLELSNSLTSVGRFFLADCKSLTSLILPNSLTIVGNQFLFGCTGLTSLQLPNSLTSVDYDFLMDCSGLTSLELPKKLTTVGDAFLYGCSGLTSLELPDSLTTVGNDFLVSCTELTNLQLPNSLTSVGDEFLENCLNLMNLFITKKTFNQLKEYTGFNEFIKKTKAKIVIVKDQKNRTFA